MPAAMPVPASDRETFGVVVSLLANARAADRAPPPVGLKRTSAVNVPPGSIENSEPVTSAPAALRTVMMKSAALAPDAPKPEIDSACAPSLEIENVIGSLVVPVSSGVGNVAPVAGTPPCVTLTVGVGASVRTDRL